VKTLRRCERSSESRQEGCLTRLGCASDRQALAPFGATASKNLPACTRCHARTKSVRALTMNLARLVSALHAESRGAKIALKQAHGGSKRRAGRVRSRPGAVKREST
jgi:hypothetical protein